MASEREREAAVGLEGERVDGGRPPTPPEPQWRPPAGFWPAGSLGVVLGRGRPPVGRPGLPPGDGRKGIVTAWWSHSGEAASGATMQKRHL